ncbi:transglycosylase family protein [Janibacter terrae]|uniref:transglycosylase family protein n=1 Tax=Janibacter terrae TaxID=103817 RepID=UPI0008324B7C
MTSTTRHSTTRRAAQALAVAGFLTMAGTGTAMAAGPGDLPGDRGQASEHAADQAFERASDNASFTRDAAAETSDAQAETDTATSTSETSTETVSTTSETSESTTTEGSYPSVWDAVAECESGGDWDIDTGNGFYGGLQFSPDTWLAYGGDRYAPTADQATTAQQVEIAQEVLEGQGPGAWPVCSQEAGLTTTNGA